MLAKLLIGLITVSYSDYCLTETFVLCTEGSYLICTLIKNCMVDGKMNFLKHLQPLMVLKQGGVISLILFCVYMDGLLTELANSGYGCYMSGVFAGAFSYADDLKLLTPSVYALHQMAHICGNYAKRYDIIFNAKKRQVIIYKAYNVKPPDPCVVINGAPVKCVVIHLGQLLTENVSEFNVSKCIDDFNRQCNMFFADFKHCSCYIRNILFQRY